MLFRIVLNNIGTLFSARITYLISNNYDFFSDFHNNYFE